MTWHAWGAFPDDTGPFFVYAAPDTADRSDGLDFIDPRDGLDHLGTVESDCTLAAIADDPDTWSLAGPDIDQCDLVDGIASYFPDTAKGFDGRGVSITYGPA